VFAESISKTENTEFTDYERIDRALRDGSRPIVFQKEYDLTKHLPAARKIAQGAVTEMKRVVQDGNDIDNIILSGGGAFFFRPVIQEAFPRHKLKELKDGLYSNVIGFQLAGMESLRQELQRQDSVPSASPPEGAPANGTEGGICG
jgi:plasmid segregation protein ParM